MKKQALNITSDPEKAVFEKSGLTFAYITETDLPDIVRMLAKESVCEYVFFGPNTEQETRAYFEPLVESIQTALAEKNHPTEHIFTIRKDGEFLGQCALLPVEVVSRQSTDTVALSDEIVAQAVRLIRDNATSNVTVDWIARKIDVSRSTLQRRFRQQTGRTLEKEIMRSKMDRAKRLLKETDFGLATIAEKSGFATTDYFIQAFRRENGVTPHQYRKSLRRISIRPEDDPLWGR